jgi:hypothetical protein
MSILRILDVYAPDVNKNMMSFKGQARWAIMTSSRGNQTALACHLTKKVNKREKLTYLFTNIDSDFQYSFHIKLEHL